MDEEIEIINTNTRIEKLKNFLISKRKQLITLLTFQEIVRAFLTGSLKIYLA